MQAKGRKLLQSLPTEFRQALLERGGRCVLGRCAITGRPLSGKSFTAYGFCWHLPPVGRLVAYEVSRPPRQEDAETVERNLRAWGVIGHEA